MVVSTSYGAYTTTVNAPSPEVSGLVLNDLGVAVSQMGAPTPSNYSGTFGLNVGYNYVRILGSNVRSLVYLIS
jgi:hypothetical protein